MKRFNLYLVVLFVSCSFFLSSFVLGQNRKIEDAKTALQDKALDKAKSSIDEATVHLKTFNNPEAWYIKGLVYSALALDSVLIKKYPFALDTAFEALKKSFAINSKEYIKNMSMFNQSYNPALQVYGLYYNEGSQFFTEKKFQEAANSFSKAILVNDFILSDGISNRPVFDTILVMNMASSFEQAGDKKQAALYYAKIADLKLATETYSGIYKWLAYHYYKTEVDSALFNKYVYLGKKLFPKDDFYSKIELDATRNKGGEVNYLQLFDKYEESLATNPNEIPILDAYRADLFAYIHPSSGVKPENSNLYSKKFEDVSVILAGLNKEKAPDYYFDLGKHFYNDYITINSDFRAMNIKRNSLEEPIYKLKKLKTKSKNDTKKLDSLNIELNKLNVEREKVRASFENSAKSAIKYLEEYFNVYYAKFKTGEMKGFEKTLLKTNIDYLITCYGVIKDKVKEEFYNNKYDEIK